MAEREEQLGSSDAGTVGVAVLGSEAMAGGVAEAVASAEVRLGEPLLPLQDPWFCLTSLFPIVGALEKELLPIPIQFLCPCGITVGWSDWVEQKVADEGFCQILRNAKIFEAVVVSLTLEDVDRICLLPSMGDVNLLELGLSDEESAIARKLLEMFGDVGDVKMANWVVRAAGPNGELRFFGFEDGLPLLMKWMGLKIPNFLLITYPSYIPYPSGAEFDLIHNPHRVLRQFRFDQDVLHINAIRCPLSDAMKPLVHSTALEYWASKVERVLVLSRHREGYATSNMKLYWKKVMITFVDYATRQNLGFVEWRVDLNSWVVHGGDVPLEWSEKNVIVRGPESNPATGAPKRSRGKFPSSENKPKKVRRRRASAKKPKAGSPKPPAVVQSGSSAAPATKSSVPTAAYASTPSRLKQYRRKTNAGRVWVPESSEESGYSEKTQSEEYDFVHTAADFGKLLFLASVSYRISSLDVLYSLGPTDEDIEIADEGPTIAVTAGKIATKMLIQEHVSKDPNVIITAREAIAGVPSQRHVVSSIVHDVHQSKEPPEGQPLLEAIVRKYPHFMTVCKLGASFRKSGLQLFVAVLLDMQCTKLESTNLKKALEWKNSLKDLLFMKFGVQFILDKIWVAAGACIARDDELTVKIANLKKEIAAKRVELSLLLSQRDEMMWSSSVGGASSSVETFGDGLFD
nr:hypothetical protein CFP56_55808 [Quercus suber]